MSRSLTASDRSALTRLASSLPPGSAERKTILAGLSREAFTAPPPSMIPAFDLARELRPGTIFTHLESHDLVALKNGFALREGLDYRIFTAHYSGGKYSFYQEIKLNNFDKESLAALLKL